VLGLAWVRARRRRRWSAESGGAGGLRRWWGEPLWCRKESSWFRGAWGTEDRGNNFQNVESKNEDMEADQGKGVTERLRRS